MSKNKHKGDKNPSEFSPTQFTLTGVLSLHNRKPYRTASQKEEARRTAYKGKDGAWHSPAPVSYHSAPKGSN